MKNCKKAKTNNKPRRCFKNILASLILMLTLSAFFSLNDVVYATTSSLTISVADSIALDLTPKADGSGSFAHSSTSTNTVSISTTNGTGYTLGIKASSNNNNALINSSDSSKIIPSITSSISESTYSSSSTYNNTWGYRPSKLNSSSNSNYLQAPTSASTITTIERTSVANPSTANTYNLAIGARVNSSTTPGSYSNTFVLTVVANPTVYSITYNANGGSDTVTNMPSNITNQQTSSETVNISSIVPVRDGYNFKGWCTTQTEDGGTCSGTAYNPDGGGTDLTWTLDHTASSNSLSLYAIWNVSKNYIQNLTLSQCQVNVGTNGNAANIGDNITVYDKRDENDYTVRYINGECWMTQNLRFQGSSIDTTNTNTNTNKTITWYDLGSTEASSTSEHCNIAYTFDSNWNVIYTSGNGFIYACKHDSGSATNGVWYNFAGASAMTITGVSNSNLTTYDICPKNWHLPTGPSTTANTDYNKLVGNTTSGYQNPTTGFTAFGAVVGGYYNDTSFGNTGYGLWWSATPNGTDIRYGLVYNSRFGFSGSRNIGRYSGVYARCVRSS